MNYSYIAVTNGCGWALAVEAALAISFPTIKPVTLSSQMVAECTNEASGFPSDVGCSGGLPEDALRFMSSFSVPLFTLYPNTFVTTGSTLGLCNSSMMSLPWGNGNWLQASGMWSPAAMNETMLMVAVAVQPLVVVLTVGMEFLSWSKDMAKHNVGIWNWNDDGIFIPYRVYMMPISFPPAHIPDGRLDNGDNITDINSDMCGSSTSIDTNNQFAGGCVYGLVAPVMYATLDMLVVGYNTKSLSYWSLQSTFGSNWASGSGGGFINVAMTGDATGPCGMYTIPAVAPNMGFVHLPALNNGPQPPSHSPVPPYSRAVATAQMQRTALFKLTMALMPIRTALKTLVHDWNPNTLPCGPPTWPYITCQTVQSAMPVVTGLTLAGTAFTGAIPSCISALTFLRMLNLSSTQFDTSSWSRLAALTQLELLDLSKSGKSPEAFNSVISKNTCLCTMFVKIPVFVQCLLKDLSLFNVC